MGRFLLILILSSFVIELYSLPLQQESLTSVSIQPKNSQEQRTDKQISSENAIKHSSKLQHVFIRRSSGGGSRGGGSRGGGSRGGGARSATTFNPVYVGGNGHNSHHSGAPTRNPIGFSGLIGVTLMLSLLHIYVAFGRR